MPRQAAKTARRQRAIDDGPQYALSAQDVTDYLETLHAELGKIAENVDRWGDTIEAVVKRVERLEKIVGRIDQRSRGDG
jgi:hypothetical protein